MKNITFYLFFIVGIFFNTSIISFNFLSISKSDYEFLLNFLYRFNNRFISIIKFLKEIKEFDEYYHKQNLLFLSRLRNPSINLNKKSEFISYPNFNLALESFDQYVYILEHLEKTAILSNKVKLKSIREKIRTFTSDEFKNLFEIQKNIENKELIWKKDIKRYHSIFKESIENIKNLFMDKAYKSYIETDKTMIHIYKIFKNYSYEQINIIYSFWNIIIANRITIIKNLYLELMNEYQIKYNQIPFIINYNNYNDYTITTTSLPFYL
jgi:hypothetical protein